MGAIRQMKKGKAQPSLVEKLKEAFMKGYSKGFEQGVKEQRAQGIESTVTLLEGLENIPGIGEKTAWKIREHVMKQFGSNNSEV